jgi:hypothetical protein
MNNDRWKKYSNPRWWRRRIDNRRGRIITSFSVAIVTIRPIITAVVIITAPSVPVTTVVMFYDTFMVIFAEGRRHVNTSDHCD